MKKYDLIVLGGGRSCQLAIKASKLGKKVALIEKSLLGGTCANKGCVPSKLLISYSDVIRAIKNSSKHYIDSKITNINIKKIFDKNKEFINSVDPEYVSKLNENITLYRKEAYFISNNIIKVGKEEITASNIIIATGSRPKKAPFEGALTSDDIFPIENIPKSITIVGSGFIACELANVFDALGIKTKLLVRGDKLLSNEDEEISSTFTEEFSKNINIEFNTTIKDAKYENNNFLIQIEKKNNESSSYECEALLYAIGRESNADLLKLENTKIQLDKKGYIQRDKYFETAEKNIYVVGDASGEYMLQHAAAYEINYLYKYLFEEEKEALSFKYMPHAIFTSPEIASVGITEKVAKENELSYVVSKTSWEASAKAKGKKLKYPFTKFIVDKKNYKILGCHIIGPESSTIIHQVLTVMHIDNDIRHLKEMLYIHPALSEVLLPAAINSIKKIENEK